MYARPFTVLAIAVVIASAGFVSAPRLRLDTSLEALLPADTVDALEVARRRYAGEAPMHLIVQSSDPELNRRLSREIAAELGGWDEVVWAISRRDPSFFSRRRLLYLDTEHLESLAERAERVAEWIDCERHPVCTNLDEQPPTPDVDDAFEELAEDDQVRSLLGVFGVETTAELRAATDDQSTSADDGDPRTGDLCRPDGELCLVYAVLRGDPADLQYAQSVVDEAHAILARVDVGASPPSDLELRISGRYRQYAAQHGQVSGDLWQIGLVSVLLVWLVLATQFRGVRWGLLLFGPLVIGAGWLLLLLAWLAPPLNVMSAATLAIFAGIGVDLGVHLLMRYGAEHRDGRDHRGAVGGAVGRAITGLARPLLLASATTAAAFAGLAFGRFEGFAQMGILCALAIVVTLVSYVVVFPSLVIVADRIVPEPGSATRGWSLPTLPGRYARWTVSVGALLAFAGLAALPFLEFEYDLRRLSGPPSQTARPGDPGPVLQGVTRSPTLLLADSPEALARAADGLRAEFPDGLLRDQPWRLLTPATFVPRDQEARLAAIARIRAVVPSLRAGGDDAEAAVAHWEPFLDPGGPIAPSDLPHWVRGLFLERDGSFGKVGILYEGGSALDARRMELRAERILQWEARYPGVRFASTAALLGQITSSLRADTPRVVGFAVLALLGCVFVASRSIRTSLVVAAPVALSIAIGLACMWLLDLRVNLYNAVVFPLAFGVGVDGAVYSTIEAREGTTSRAVVGSTLTTIAAFGSLALSSHPGLSSLGVLACVMLGATLVGNLVWLPALLKLLRLR